MGSLRFSAFIIGISIWVSVISPAQCLTCSSQTFTGNDVYAHCLDLPSLSSFLHFSYNSSNSTLSVAFIASPSASGGWVAWALNPTGTGMAGAQALVGYKNSKSAMTVNTYNISSYSSVVKSKLAFDVWDQQAEEQNGVMRIFAKIKVPSDLVAKGAVNHIWQVGPSVDEKGDLTSHAMSSSNLNAKGTLDLKGGQTVVTGEVDSRTQKKNIHGILNVVSWGFLFPVGIIMARYLRPFKSADPAWFYLHVSCQIAAYAIGVAGWATGMKLGSESQGIVYSIHRNIGITVFAFATLQVFALFLRPQKDHKYRFFWNIYHHSIGYGVLILGVMNVFRGLDILAPEQKWKSAYISVIAILGGIALLLEIITWIAVLRRSNKSTKPYDGYNAQDRLP